MEQSKRRDARMTVLGAEEQRDDQRYVARVGAAEMEPSNFTLIRQRERFFKHTKDFSDSIDFHSQESIARFKDVLVRDTSAVSKHDMFRFANVPGLIILPAFLSLSRQQELVANVFEDELNMRNLTSLHAVYDLPPEETLYSLYKRHGKDHELTLVRKDNQSQVTLSLENWLRKIRWINIGLYYDWTTKTYNFEHEKLSFPYIQKLAQELASEVNMTIKPEAGIINQYQLKDSLTAHVDRYEKDMSIPLISMSIGNSCVFLIGGESRDDPVTSIILNSGDVLIMSGESRKFLHGVPKILPYSTCTFPSDPLFNLIKDARININVRQVE